MHYDVMSVKSHTEHRTVVRIVMRSEFGGKRRSLSVSNGRRCAGACGKIPRTFAQSVPLFSNEQTWELSDEVSPYLTVACVQVPVRKFPERLPTAYLYLIRLFFLPLFVRVYLYV